MPELLWRTQTSDLCFCSKKGRSPQKDLFLLLLDHVFQPDEALPWCRALPQSEGASIRQTDQKHEMESYGPSLEIQGRS